MSDLTYDLRSGAPDFLDTLVASTFGTMAYDALTQNKHGLMASITDGKFAMVPIPDPKLGPRMWTLNRCTTQIVTGPSYANKEGLPVFLDPGA